MDSCKSSFGEEVVYTPQGEDPVTLTAIVDEAFESIDPNTGATLISQQPKIGLKITDMPVPPQRNDTVVVRGTTYVVIEEQTDGQAGTRLLLQEQ